MYFDPIIRALSIPFIVATIFFAIKHAVLAAQKTKKNGFRRGHILIYLTLAAGAMIRLPYIISTFYPETHWVVEMLGTPVVTSGLWMMFGFAFYVSDRSVRREH